MSRPVRVGLIGCGFQGAHHVACLHRGGPLRLDRVCDADQQLAEQLAATSPTAVVAQHWHDVMRDPDLDAVIIATTSHTHTELAIEAARNGKHILLEKPMAIAVKDCTAIEQAVADAGICLMVEFKFRFAPAVATARAAVPNPILLVAQTLYDLTQSTVGWINDPAKSGGRLLSSLVHAVDLLRYLSSSEPVRVTAAGGTLAIEGLNEPDNVVATIEFANGSIGSIVHGTAGRSALLSTWSFQSVGRGSNATIHDHGRRVLVHDATAIDDPFEFVDPVADPFQVGMSESYQAFANAIESGVVTTASARDGTASVAICQQILQALTTGKPQSITPIT